MATGYKVNGTDLDDLAEPYYSQAETGFTNYKTNGSSIGSRYQKEPETDSWRTPLSTGYKNNGTDLKVVPKGQFPTPTEFHRITSNGTYYISRTDSTLTIGNTTFTTSNFRNGKIPRFIGLMLIGGGGGAGGLGCSAGDKYGYNRAPSGAGGGGGICSCVIDLDILNETEYDGHSILNFFVRVPVGGDGGTDSGTGSAQTGGKGTDGSEAHFAFTEDRFSRQVVWSGGGKGSTGGVGGSGYVVTASEGGAGGSGGGASSLSKYVYSIQSVQGCKGNDWYGTYGSTSLSRLFSSTGLSPTTLVNSAVGPQAARTDNGYRNYCFAGGASGGRGGWNDPTGQYGSNTATLGGGGGSPNNRNGGNGCAIFYY